MHLSQGALCALLSTGLVSSLAPTLAAQATWVVPVANTSVEGSTSAVYPFAYYNGRSQQIWASTAVAKSGFALINGISFRRNTNNSGYPTFAGRTYTNASFKLGYTSVAPEKMSRTFASNITSTMTTVLSGTLSLPSNPMPLVKPAPFNIKMSWSSPFIYTANKGDLILDITLPGPVRKAPYFVDAEYSSGTTGGGTVAPFGTSGVFANPELFRFAGDAAGLTAGGTLAVTCGSFKKSYYGSLILGMSNRSWSGVNLPLSLVFLGAPNNNLYVSMDWQFLFNTTATTIGNTSSFRSPIPNNPAYNGLTFYTQAYYADSGANNAGLVTTNALALTIGGGGTRPETNQVGYWDYTKTTGNFTFGTRSGGPVTQFR